jgi:hypothetical protein
MTKPLLLLVAALAAAAPAWGEKHVQSTLDSQIALAFRASPAEVQKWLPVPWQVAPMASGASKDAHLMLTFVDRLLDQDAEGKPVLIASYRLVTLSIPARNPQTGEAGAVLVRQYSSNPDAVPGYYKVAVRASVERESASSAAGNDSGTASERWEIKDGKGGSQLLLQVRYERSTLTRGKAEASPRSGSDPALWRIYRIEQSVDVVKSVPEGIDRLRNYRFRSNVADLDKLFDGREQLISVTSIPWYTRQTFLPD